MVSSKIVSTSSFYNRQFRNWAIKSKKEKSTSVYTAWLILKKYFCNHSIMALNWFVERLNLIWIRSNICAKGVWNFFCSILLISMQNYYNHSQNWKKYYVKMWKRRNITSKKILTFCALLRSYDLHSIN